MQDAIIPASLYQRRDGLTAEQYRQDYKCSIEDPNTFWADAANQYLDFYTPWNSVLKGDLASGKFSWFEGATLNACYNCVDRHLPKHADDIAFLIEGDEPDSQQTITYQQLHESVCRLANVLKDLGVKKGDVVCIYMPMISEAVYAMLACARIGAVHSVVFGGFSANALRDRINDANCSIVITANEGVRGGKAVSLKQAVDEAVQACSMVQSVLVVQATETCVPMQAGRDHDYASLCNNASIHCDCEVMQAEDPLFILYTSGSTGKPKGVLHTTAGYLLYAAMSFQTVFDYKPGDVYWCTADVGWVTGHSYIVYGPLSQRATSVLFAGVPTYPDASRCWQVIDKYQVNIFYTAPTAIRALMQAGDKYLQTTSRDSLRILGTVGEPINPEAWRWYFNTVGHGKCPIMDTWWQTETGGFMIAPLAGITELKPGSATLPFYGVQVAILDDQNKEVRGEGCGRLVIKAPWPGLMRTVYQDHHRFVDTYLKVVPGYYFTGDGARRDGDGYYWITGRVDDVINVSGHRLGTAEIESALVAHESVAEAAVVGYPHPIKGEGIYAFVTLKYGVEATDALQVVLREFVREQLGAIAKPDEIHWAKALPKTRSGKIMRRILRKIASGERDDLGDVSTLADPDVLSAL